MCKTFPDIHKACLLVVQPVYIRLFRISCFTPYLRLSGVPGYWIHESMHQDMWPGSYLTRSYYHPSRGSGTTPYRLDNKEVIIEQDCNALVELFDCFNKFRIYLYDYVIY